MEYPINPYNKDSQPLSHHLQEQKNWKTFFDTAFAPINEAYTPKAQPPAPAMPFPTAGTPSSSGPPRPLMTREEVAALLAAPLPWDQEAFNARLDAELAEKERRQDRNMAIGIVVVLFLVLAFVTH